MKHARLALVCLVAIMMAGAGCGHRLATDEGENPGSAVTPVLSVAAAPVTVNPMHSELDLLRTPAAPPPPAV